MDECVYLHTEKRTHIRNHVVHVSFVDCGNTKITHWKFQSVQLLKLDTVWKKRNGQFPSFISLSFNFFFFSKTGQFPNFVIWCHVDDLTGSIFLWIHMMLARYFLSNRIRLWRSSVLHLKLGHYTEFQRMFLRSTFCTWYQHCISVCVRYAAFEQIWKTRMKRSNYYRM